jgi:heme/copper-type cytochrome/quinol oxidase subunit 3
MAAFLSQSGKFPRFLLRGVKFAFFRIVYVHRSSYNQRYFEAQFTIADSAYGSTIFVATGFHGTRNY